jgi:hypothetical protein
LETGAPPGGLARRRASPDAFRMAMIAMTNFGQNGRFGNQLFQYAFMRSEAARLGARLFLSRWDGDTTFDLQDDPIRCAKPSPNLGTYTEPFESCGFNPVQLADNVDVSGHFQSETMFEVALMRRCYSFRREIAREARSLLGPDFDGNRDVALGLRLTDFETLPTHYVPRIAYYRAGLTRLGGGRVYLFSDDVVRAQKLIRRTGFQGEIRKVCASPPVKLAAMAEFARFVIGPSTFHWWGAWLSRAPGKRVIVPLEGATCPGAPMQARDYWPRDWEPLPALGWTDCYRVRLLKNPFLRRWRRLQERFQPDPA